MTETDKEKIEEKNVSDGYILVEDGYGFYKFIEAVSNIGDEVPLDFDPINLVLNMPVMDCARICLMGIAIRGFEIVGDIRGERVYVNLKDLKTLLKSKKEAKKEVKLIFGNREKLFVEKTNKRDGTIKKTLMYLDMETEDMPIENLEKIEYPNHVAMHKVLLSDMFYEANNYSDIVKIETCDRGIFFREEGHIGEFEAFYDYDKLNECECKGTEKSAYSYTYLNLIKNFLNIMGKDDVVHFHQKTNHPLKIVIELKSIDTDVTYYIAPRVEEEEFDWDDDEDDDW